MYNEEVASLLITLIVSFDDLGEKIKFTKEQIDSLIKEYDVVSGEFYGELGSFILWEHGYMSDEHFAKKMDLVYKDKKFYLKIKKFNEIINDESAGVLHYELEGDPGYYDVGIDQFFDDFTDETLKVIIEKSIGITTQYEDIEITISKKNTYIKDKKIFIKEKNDVIELLEQLNEPEFEEIKNEINYAIVESQWNANQFAIYKGVKKSFEYNIGEFSFVKDEEILIDLNYNDLLSIARDGLNDKYSGLDRYTEESYGNFLYMADEFEMFNGVDKPNYEAYGDIEKDDLNENIQNKLYWLK